jgi:hypothetical protein
MQEEKFEILDFLAKKIFLLNLKGSWYSSPKKL